MKKDSKRRQIRDAIDFMTDEDIGIQTSEIAIDLIDEFSVHPFHLYEGKRLEDMVESIRTNGVLNPVIVRKIGERYEMLSGHNRMNASKLAGIETVPALVKEGLSEEEAYVYVLETNLMQRSFNDMYPSEKAIVLQLRYDKIANQGKRTDIERELRALESGEEIPDEEPQIDSRGRIAKEYGLSGRTMARLLRINDLTED
jgi:ParB family chromosome partitioning protein